MEETNQTVKIIQLLTAPWDQDDRKRTYSIIGLASNGGVYRLDKAAGGWIPLPRGIISQTEAAKAKKARYSVHGDDGRPKGSPYKGQG